MRKNIFQAFEHYSVDNEFDSEKEFIEQFTARKKISFNLDAEENLYED